MNWWLAYEITLALLVLVALLWAWDARRLLAKAKRLVELHDDQPTQEIPTLPTMRLGPARLEDLGGPARPVPPDWFWAKREQ